MVDRDRCEPIPGGQHQGRAKLPPLPRKALLRVEGEGVQRDDWIDPDPFTIGLAIFSAVAGGGTFLEARRQRHATERQHRDEFRAAWYNARRTVIFFKRGVDEFETYLLEEGFGRKEFRIGAVRLVVDRQRHQQLRRLRGQTFITANIIGDNLDDLSEYLGPDDLEGVTTILTTLEQMRMPERYIDVIRTARQAVALYSDFLNDIDERQGFTAEDQG
jgi:hypothetical protein